MSIREITYVAPSSARQRAEVLPADRTYLALKRLTDIVLSALALIVLSPLFLVIAIAIKLDSPGPVIFRQKRVRGQQDPNEEHPERVVFDFFKFRSMYTNCDAQLHREYVRAYIAGQHDKINNGSASKPLYKMKDDPRITRVGRFLRRTSLPIDPRKQWPVGGMAQFGISGASKIPPNLQAQPGKVLCVWGDAGWGKLVGTGKYRDGVFSDELVRACVKLMGEVLVCTARGFFLPVVVATG